jgi:hypothetical protein
MHEGGQKRSPFCLPSSSFPFHRGGKREGARARGPVVRPPDGGRRDEQTNGEGGADSGGEEGRGAAMLVVGQSCSVLLGRRLFSPRCVSAAAFDGRRPGNHLHCTRDRE